MKKYEKELLNRFDELYMTEVNGWTWNDCCDYDENDKPTYFYFTKNMCNYSYLYIDGDYQQNRYEVHRVDEDGDELLKVTKTLRGAMK